jgi:hypothetical protein
MGVPLHIAALYGASNVFEKRVDAYRRAATESGFDPKKLPIAVATMMYLDKDSKKALKDYFLFLIIHLRRQEAPLFQRTIMLKQPASKMP